MKEKPLSKKKDVDSGNDHILMLINDDYNTFDHVIEALVEVCGHDPLQAEQCAVITHFKGSCVVKSGSVNVLSGMRNGLNNRKLSSEINSL
ncbi:MAG: ATP-dependent Clp protease adaptor ClpS [Bacteroidales bacterium]|nr:ATP-dependent Clp protease adaptor ClpS [Bacteroidales bacterium]